jgi:hypothetical protein
MKAVEAVRRWLHPACEHRCCDISPEGLRYHSHLFKPAQCWLCQELQRAEESA